MDNLPYNDDQVFTTDGGRRNEEFGDVYVSRITSVERKYIREAIKSMRWECASARNDGGLRLDNLTLELAGWMAAMDIDSCAVDGEMISLRVHPRYDVYLFAKRASDESTQVWSVIDVDIPATSTSLYNFV